MTTETQQQARDRHGDLLLERPLLASRFRKAIADGDHDEAVRLLRRIRQLPDELFVAELIAHGGKYSTRRDELELQLRGILRAAGIRE
jgi:hypothetical protein